nr:unnamed protein product [Spirometra erinaceieuropaei]
MVPRRGAALCTSRRCELRHLAAWAEYVITCRQINVSIDGVGVRHPRFQQSSPRLVAGSRQYPRAGEVELIAFLQRVGSLNWPVVFEADSYVTSLEGLDDCSTFSQLRRRACPHSTANSYQSVL